MTTSRRILIADDHAMIRAGLGLIIEREPDLCVVAEAADGHDAVEQALAHQPDLVLMDITMPRLNGLQAVHELRRRGALTPVLMLSVHDNEQFFFEALDAGASGYVLKAAADYELIDACRACLRGEPVVFAGAARALIRDYLAHRPSDQPSPDPLSPRELEIVQLIAEGRSGREIAHLLTLSEKTVDRHRTNILAKLGLHDRLQLTRYAIRRGIIEP